MNTKQRAKLSFIFINLILFISVLFCAVLHISCAASGSTVQRFGTRKNKCRKIPPEKQVALDIYTVGGDDWTPDWNPSPQSMMRSNMKRFYERLPQNKSISISETSDNSGELQAPRMVQGFRVQLANVTDEELADGVREQALAFFDSVYVSFQRPNYKVRAGDYITRALADIAADSARVKGFPDAWVVPSKVYNIGK